MLPSLGDYLVIGAVAAVVTFAVTPLVGALARRVGWVYLPSDRTVHTEPMPDVGGLAMLIGFLVAFGTARLLDQFDPLFARNSEPRGIVIAAVIIFLAIAWLSSAPRTIDPTAEVAAAPSAQAFLDSEHFPAVSQTVMGRCMMCHSAEPVWDGIHEAPRDVRFDSANAIANYAAEIAIQAGYSHAMPPGNVTGMTEPERALIVAWYREASGR